MKKPYWIAAGLLAIYATNLLATTAPTATSADEVPTAEMVATALNLSSHVEGGYYRRSYQADHRDPVITQSGERFLMTSIYYMLTTQSPVGHFHLNKSDIMHYYHLGDPIRYTLLHPDGKIETFVMGADVTQGEMLQLDVKGGIWKASELSPGKHGYGLISEAVTPGFDFADMTLGKKPQLSKLFPQHAQLFEKLAKSE